MHCGKPISYWEDKGIDLVIDVLVRGATRYAPSANTGIDNPMQDYAHQALMDLANGISRAKTSAAISERNQILAGFAAVMATMTGPVRAVKSSKVSQGGEPMWTAAAKPDEALKKLDSLRKKPARKRR